MDAYIYFVSYSHAWPGRGDGFGATSVTLAEPVTDWSGVEALTDAVVENSNHELPRSAIVIVNFILLTGPADAGRAVLEAHRDQEG